MNDCRNCIYYREKYDHCFYNATEFNKEGYNKANKCVIYTKNDATGLGCISGESEE